MVKSFYDHYMFEGTHKQVGQQHGEALREQIQHHLHFIFDQSDHKSGLTREKVLSVAASFDPYIQSYAPGFAEELHGLANGAGISYNEALLLQARQEVLNMQQFGRGEMECTSFAIRPEYTITGKMYAGQNADLTGEFKSFTNVITFKVTGKPQVMMVTPAGQISYQGCNDQGMSINCNFLVCNGWKQGFPRYLTSRLAIEQKSFSEARSVMEKLERASSRNLLLCHKDGDIVDFETTATDFEPIVVQTPYFVHSNHFLSDRMKQYEGNNEYEGINSHHRLDRLNQLIAKNRGNIDSRLIKSFLRDHANEPHTLCMHPDIPDNRAHTFASIIINLTDCVMEVCRGNPCCNEYATYEFYS